MTDTRQIELLNAIQAEQRRRRDLRRNACSTCREWADVIHAQISETLREQWGPWPEPDHRCPACGREPEVSCSIGLSTRANRTTQPSASAIRSAAPV